MATIREFRIKNQKKALFIGFTLIILMIGVLGIVSKVLLTRMANTMNQFYEHPYIVSNTTQRIKLNLVSMQSDMKDVVVANTAQDLNLAIEHIQQHEDKVLKDFDLLSDRFLGEKHAINACYRLVIQWQAIRAEIIALIRQDQHEQAMVLTKGKETDLLKQLMVNVEEINSFANHKAKSFQQEFEVAKLEALWINYGFTIFSIIFILLLATRTIKRAILSEKEQNEKEHLIDQNILLAELDHEGVVLDASNALCRFLGKDKPEVIGQKSHFFDNSKRSSKVNAAILSVLKTGAEWRGEVQYINREGKSCWAQSTIAPSFDKQYQIKSFTNTLVSITNKKLAIIDELTGLYNRRGFDAILSREFHNTQRDASYLNLAILDIDYFKKFNDLYGHPAGDEALRKVSSVFSSTVDDTCFAFRIGGEEFAIVFVDQSIETSKQKLLWIKEQVQSLEIPHKENLVSDFLTISIGMFSLSPSSKVEEGRLYSIADKALYQAKLKRNALVVTSKAPESMTTS
ncbi:MULTISPECIES: diguanylate cyclase [unclassified Marinomonas]|uniref:diguanylate cyclase n=1 Tax=unclassified Marinomonas TaxID=196814 RepID=UPI000A5E800E|nr:MULTISPECIES: diguanylate cyclase [unclassified Marinomonas]